MDVLRLRMPTPTIKRVGILSADRRKVLESRFQFVAETLQKLETTECKNEQEAADVLERWAGLTFVLIEIEKLLRA
jgi:hypothetical protein